MGFYSDTIVPRLVTCACGTKPILKQREKIVPLATGRVLEIGVGAGHNLSITIHGKWILLLGSIRAPLVGA